MARIPSRHNEAWTPEELAQLARLAGRNTTAGEIGRLLGRTADAVRSKASKENISLRAASQITVRTISSMAAEARDYVYGKLLAGVADYTRRNTGQVMTPTLIGG